MQRRELGTAALVISLAVFAACGGGAAKATVPETITPTATVTATATLTPPTATPTLSPLASMIRSAIELRMRRQFGDKCSTCHPDRADWPGDPPSGRQANR